MVSVGSVLAPLPWLLLWWAPDGGEQVVEQDAHGTWEAKGSKWEVQPQDFLQIYVQWPTVLY